MRKTYKILKMKSGEEIIADVRKTKDGQLRLHRPMVFKSMVSSDLFGGMREIFMLKNWLILSSEVKTLISPDTVNAILEPTKEASNLYDAEKIKEDFRFNGVKAKRKEPLLPPPNLPEIKDQSDSFLDNLQKKLEDMMTNLDDPVENESNLKDLAKPRFDDKMIFMNMVFSPEVIVELLRSGILDRKDFGEMINEITDENGEGMNPNKFTGDKKENKNLGNEWTDWNADPSSEDYK